MGVSIVEVAEGIKPEVVGFSFRQPKLQDQRTATQCLQHRTVQPMVELTRR
ncbi:hypothetical protein C789_4161 [Microcystis aeruginosa FACHB-905 = DIANCHI905]|nr:hypothetical protein C789_4161 [Microcystis aeruginosa FACHB-905 = DIANCHI905]